MIPRTPRPTRADPLFPYTTHFRSLPLAGIERTAHRELYPCAAADPAPLGRCIDLRQQRAIETEHHRRPARLGPLPRLVGLRSEEHTSELQSLMRISYAVFCLKKKNTHSHASNTELTNTDTNT